MSRATTRKTAAPCPVGPSPALLDPSTDRIAVLRALQVGDLLCAIPALRALRRAAPRAHITLVGLPWARQLLPRFPAYLDDFIAFPGFPGLPERNPDLAALPPFFHGIRSRRYDVVLQMHGNGSRTNHIAAAFGGRRLAGFRPPGTQAPADALLLPYPDHGHEIHRLLSLCDALGAPALGDRLEFPLLPTDRAELTQWPALQALQPGRYICLHPGARSPAQRWPAHCFAALGDALSRRYGMPVVLTGSAADAELTAQIRGVMQAPALNAALPLSLGGLAALLSGAALAVTNDTGVSHLLAALGVRSVVLSQNASPERWGPLNCKLHSWVSDPQGRRLREVQQTAEALLDHL